MPTSPRSLLSPPELIDALPHPTGNTLHFPFHCPRLKNALRFGLCNQSRTARSLIQTNVPESVTFRNYPARCVRFRGSTAGVSRKWLCKRGGGEGAWLNLRPSENSDTTKSKSKRALGSRAAGEARRPESVGSSIPAKGHSRRSKAQQPRLPEPANEINRCGPSPIPRPPVSRPLRV